MTIYRQDALGTHTSASQRNQKWISSSGGASAVYAMDMSEVIRAAQLGDERAFGQLVRHYQSAAQRLAQHIMSTEEAAADAVQDALIKVHRALPRFEDGNFRSWLLRIVTNTCYDHLRSQKRRPALSLDELTEASGPDLPFMRTGDSHNPEVVVSQRENMEFLLRTIEDLPDWHRDVVLLVDVHGYDYSEAAEILDLPLGTVKSRLSRARATLRDRLVESAHFPRYAGPQ
jgi:RNA polymerase sigma-70 factor (ECF subfamily)